LPLLKFQPSYYLLDTEEGKVSTKLKCFRSKQVYKVDEVGASEVTARENRVGKAGSSSGNQP